MLIRSDESLVKVRNDLFQELVLVDLEVELVLLVLDLCEYVEHDEVGRFGFGRSYLFFWDFVFD